MSSTNITYLPVYQQPQVTQQQQQQVYQQQLTQEQLNEMTVYYNQIYQKLFQILFTENGKKYIDTLNLFPLVQSQNDIPKDKMSNVFKHLLAYTYSATASEITNHQEVNAQLKEIKETLKKIIKQETKTETTAPVTAA